MDGKTEQNPKIMSSHLSFCFFLLSQKTDSKKEHTHLFPYKNFAYVNPSIRTDLESAFLRTRIGLSQFHKKLSDVYRVK